VEAHGGMNSRVTNIFEHTGNVTMPTEITGDKFDIARGAQGKISGMDKINSPMEPIHQIRTAVGYMSNSVNWENLQRLTLDPSAVQLSDPGHFGTVEDEMYLPNLFKKRTFYRSFAWNASQPAGTILSSDFLTPMAQVLPLVADHSVEVSLLDFICAKFQYWRGGFVLDFDIVCTTWHSGKLWLGLHYGEATAPATLLGATNEYGLLLILIKKTITLHLWSHFIVAILGNVCSMGAWILVLQVTHVVHGPCGFLIRLFILRL